MTYSIERAVVLGSGVMGSGIAAHLANLGIHTLMLDRVPERLTDKEMKKGLTLDDPEVRNRLAISSKLALLSQKPSPLTSKANLKFIEVGNFLDDMEKISQADWVIEAVVEDLEIKKAIYEQVDRYYKQGTIVSSNTSGISVHEMIADCSYDLRSHFLGTHFFNPPRYLRLLEIIPTKDTDPSVIQFMTTFAKEKLGKDVVLAKDTPNFIANRIGTYGLLVTVQEMLKRGFSIGEVDSITGPLIGRPKSATFRTLDVVGLDTFIQVARNVYQNVEGKEKAVFAIPKFMIDMQKNGWLGSKTGQGFYKKHKENGQTTILELNPLTLEYESRKKLKTAATQMAMQSQGVEQKLKTLVSAKGDRAGDFIWAVLKQVLLYSAEIVYDIADDIVSIDKAMRFGFGWELGPFEIWDTIGLRKTVARMEAEGETIPEWVLAFIEAGNDSFYKQEQEQRFYYSNGYFRIFPDDEKEIDLERIKNKYGVIKKNSGASLIDLGDDVLCLEFHSRNNAIGLDIIQMVETALEELEKNYVGLVIGNQGKHFCVGANLALMLMEAQDENFDELEFVVRQFQNMTMHLKYAKKPVVIAPFNMTLGGGAEVALIGHKIQASMETYMGLVEFGVGLIPGGGGTKELYLKQLREQSEIVPKNLLQIANEVFQTIAMAKVSTSAQEARELGYLNQHDRISLNHHHLLFDAKQQVLALTISGFQARQPEEIPVVGEAGYAAMMMGAKALQYGGYASAHDLKIAEKLAYVLSGGRISEGSLITEQVMLDLEREAFLSLIGEPLTQARMQYMLLKGKPLRN